VASVPTKGDARHSLPRGDWTVPLEDQPEPEFKLATSLFSRVPAKVYALEIVYWTETVKVIE
jgi:hypothetical protein